MKKKITSIIILFLIVLTAAGCGKGDKVKKTTLYIDKDGTITQAIIESLDEDYFSEKDMTKWVEDAVAEYNKENKDALDIKKCETEKKTAKVTIEYKSMKDYCAFNQVEAFEGTVSQAEKEGYDLNREYKSAKGKPPVSMEELSGSKEYHIVILEESQTVVFKKDVLYASSNVKCDGQKAAAKVAAGEYAYIIYKP